jgi:leucyl-tRNA---protein transferase
MILLQEPGLGPWGPCPYIPGRMCRFEYFFAYDLTADDLEELFSRGWRKFGEYYFRPNCGECCRCVPLRVLAGEFAPTKSQRRVLRSCEGIEVHFRELEYRDELFEIYRDHSLNRFGKESDENEFFTAFFTRSCPAMQSEYFLGRELIGAGFIDISREGLSSVYYIYKTSAEQYRLGTFSVIREVEHAASLGLKYYYLGYYVKENPHMEYKGHFHPHETFDWSGQIWTREDDKSIEK